MTCPIHGTELGRYKTAWGPCWVCIDPECTVLCWNGNTSTPADAETRGLRHKCHEAFDPLWSTKTRFETRGKAYRWLKREMEGVAHIGHMTAEQCRVLLDKLEALNDNQP